MKTLEGKVQEDTRHAGYVKEVKEGGKGRRRRKRRGGRDCDGEKTEAGAKEIRKEAWKGRYQ